MKNPIERPIDLPPDRARQLLALRRDALVLPMAPRPHVGDAEVRALLAALTKFGCAPEDTSPVGVFDLAFREGLLPTLRCPWGRGGDVLWVREPWAQVGRGYRYCPRSEPGPDDVVWLSSARMPRVASRLALKIDDVGIACPAGVWSWVLEVERVQ